MQIRFVFDGWFKDRQSAEHFRQQNLSNPYNYKFQGFVEGVGEHNGKFGCLWYSEV